MHSRYQAESKEHPNQPSSDIMHCTSSNIAGTEDKTDYQTRERTTAASTSRKASTHSNEQSGSHPKNDQTTTPNTKFLQNQLQGHAATDQGEHTDGTAAVPLNKSPIGGDEMY